MQPTDKITETGKAVVELKNLLSSGAITVGEKLPEERELAEKYKMGVSTIREALLILQTLGHVEIKRGKGIFSSNGGEDMTASATSWFAEHVVQMSDFMEARRIFESSTIKLAVEKATVTEIKQLEKIHKIFEKAVEDDDLVALVESDKAFHHGIVRATHNKVLSILNHTLERTFEKYRIKALSIKKLRMNSLIPHHNILQAIKDRDAEKAHKEMVHHLDFFY